MAILEIMLVGVVDLAPWSTLPLCGNCFLDGIFGLLFGFGLCCEDGLLLLLIVFLLAGVAR